MRVASAMRRSMRLPEDVYDAETPEGVKRESYMQIEVERIFHPGEVERTLGAIEATLTDVRAAVDDWRAMRERLAEIMEGWEQDPPPVSEEEIGEAKSFLHWLDDDHFTFLGYRELDLVEEDGEHYLRLVPGSSLGVLRVRESEDSHRLRPLTEKMARFASQPQLLSAGQHHAERELFWQRLRHQEHGRHPGRVVEGTRGLRLDDAGGDGQ